MAFLKPTAGDRYNLTAGQVVPKIPLPAYLTALLTNTYQGRNQLVKIDATGNDYVNQCVANDAPYGMVFSANNLNGILSIFELRDCELVFEYVGVVTRGSKIVANGTPGVILVAGAPRDQVKQDNVNGVGTIVSIDTPATGQIVVRFG